MITTLTTKIPKFEKDFESRDEVLAQVTITSGREESANVKLVLSDFHDGEIGEVLIQIDSPVSIGTLLTAIAWAKENCRVINDVGDGGEAILLRK